MLRVSFTNQVLAAGIAATTEDPTYVASNIQLAHRPFLPWKSVGTGDQSITVDFLTATALDVVALIRASVTNAFIQGNSVNTWGAPPFNVLVQPTRTPWNSRYNHALRITSPLPAFNYRYLRILFPNQTPVDGSAVYFLGGLWAGALQAAPRDFSETYRIRRMEPKADVGPSNGAWSQRQLQGEPRASLSLPLIMQTGKPPAKSDTLKSWLEMQRQFQLVAYFLALIEDDDPAQSFVVRSMEEPSWQIGTGSTSSGELLLEEVIGP